MSRHAKCDACGKESAVRSFAMLPTDWIHVEAEEDVDHFEACSWACVAELALQKAAQEVEQP